MDSLKSCDASLDLSTASSPPALPERHVVFHNVEIREYERVVSDHPAVTSGPAVGIGWSYEKYPTLQFDDYENNHPPRRKAEQLKMPSEARYAVLKEHCGETKKSLQKTTRDIEIAKRQRRNTVTMMEFENSQVVVASAVRKFKRLVKISPSSKKEQELLWQNAQGQQSNNGSQELKDSNETTIVVKETQDVATLESDSLTDEDDLDWGPC